MGMGFTNGGLDTGALVMALIKGQDAESVPERQVFGVGGAWGVVDIHEGV